MRLIEMSSLNLENTDPDSVLDGGIDGFLEAALYQTKNKK